MALPLPVLLLGCLGAAMASAQGLPGDPAPQPLSGWVLGNATFFNASGPGACGYEGLAPTYEMALGPNSSFSLQAGRHWRWALVLRAPGQGCAGPPDALPCAKCRPRR